MSTPLGKKAALDALNQSDEEHVANKSLAQAQQILHVSATAKTERLYRKMSATEPAAHTKLFFSSEDAANCTVIANPSDIRLTHPREHGHAATMASVLVVDAQPLMREALARLLAQHHAAVTVTLVASVADAAAYALERFDLLVLDLNLPGFNNFDALLAMRAQRPAVPIVVMAAGEEQSTVLGAIEAGAMGFIPKHYSSEEIGDALSIVLAGGVYLPPLGAHATEPVPHQFRRRESDKPMTTERRSGGRRAADVPRAAADANASASDSKADAPAPKLAITPRQSQVLSLLINGLCNKAISNKLSLSQNTVKSHIAAIFRAMGVNNRTQAVVEMSRKGYQMALD